eukprot:1940260-Rhodomonas_salina.1
MRVTSTSFQEAGNSPRTRAALTIPRILSRREAGRRRKTSFGMPSGPGAFQRGSVQTTCRKSSSDTSSRRWLLSVGSTALWPLKTSAGRKASAEWRGGEVIEHNPLHSLQYHISSREAPVALEMQTMDHCVAKWREHRGRAPRALTPKKFSMPHSLLSGSATRVAAERGTSRIVHSP